MMSRYVLNYAGSGATREIVADTDKEAKRVALSLIGETAVAGWQWDDNGTNDDGQQMERLLLWTSEEMAENDDGARAVAELTVVRD
ncbi:hypothetical protein UFOVP1004_26 [uncultured Caudovirales phage]|uniref:Uncharacterized protein n=1 Tax=uncultured Caudovirales phage TaxID=2100421 RepID=A0A6J5Q5L1_9CAUD|nr:hypothetical protein UFOVP1004_26 [uncultured Caudovirales phage]